MWPFGRKRRAKPTRLRLFFDRGRSYEAAKTTRINEKHWAAATLGDADSTILTSLATLRNRVRYELRNNGYAEGMVGTFVADVVGPDGPAVQIESSDDDWNRSAEEFIRDYAEYCDQSGVDHLADLLRLAARQCWECGEAFLQRVTAVGGAPVRTRYLMIEPDRVATPLSLAGDGDVRGGIRVDGDGRPVEYFVARTHPGDSLRAAAVDDHVVVPARDMIHFYRRLRPGQTRGVPRLAPVLDEFAQLRDWDRSTLLAADTAARFAAFAYTDHPEASFDDIGEELPVFDIEPGTFSVLPRGWRVEQIRPEHPPAQYSNFKHEKLAAVGRVCGMPYLKVAADASGHNYSSARLDDQGYWDEVRVEQAFMARRLLTPMLLPVLREASLAGVIRPAPPDGFRLKYIWNERPHVDPSKEARAQTERLGNGTTTLAYECKAAGHDWEDVLRQRAREIRLALQEAETQDIDPALMLAAIGLGGGSRDTVASDANEALEDAASKLEEVSA